MRRTKKFWEKHEKEPNKEEKQENEAGVERRTQHMQ